MFHTSIRGRALGASTIMTYIAGAIVSYSFFTVQDLFGPWSPFASYFILTFLSIVFVVLAIPDTGGKDPDTIHKELELMWMKKQDKTEFERCGTSDDTHQIL